MDLLEYTKSDFEKLSNDELKKLLEECQNQEKKFLSLQMTKKILINSLYGALANKGFSLFNEKIAQAITGNGRFFIQLSANNIEKKLQSVLPSEKPYIIYGDTDSNYYQIEPIMELIKQKHPNKTINEYVDLAAKFEESVIDPVIQESIVYTYIICSSLFPLQIRTISFRLQKIRTHILSIGTCTQGVLCKVKIISDFLLTCHTITYT